MFETMLGTGPVVAAVLALLILASVMSWAVIWLKFRELRGAERDTREFLAAYVESSLDAAYEVARKATRSPIAALYKAGFTELARLEKTAGDLSRVRPDQVEAVVKRLSWVRAEQSQRLERGLSFLATTGSTAPFVGLFGTVVGIMNSFHQIGRSGTASLAVVAPGISEALVATAVGLFAAIPAVVAYNYANARLTGMNERIDAFVDEFRDVLRRTGTRAA